MQVVEVEAIVRMPSGTSYHQVVPRVTMPLPTTTTTTTTTTTSHQVVLKVTMAL
jgi:hypothetical protein